MGVLLRRADSEAALGGAAGAAHPEHAARGDDIQHRGHPPVRHHGHLRFVHRAGQRPHARGGLPRAPALQRPYVPPHLPARGGDQRHLRWSGPRPHRQLPAGPGARPHPPERARLHRDLGGAAHQGRRVCVDRVPRHARLPRARPAGRAQRQSRQEGGKPGQGEEGGGEEERGKGGDDRTSSRGDRHERARGRGRGIRQGKRGRRAGSGEVPPQRGGRGDKERQPGGGVRRGWQWQDVAAGGHSWRHGHDRRRDLRAGELRVRVAGAVDHELHRARKHSIWY
mmetsp:Transcript_33210/g.63759  ORF Transcript_33210/g.63759 Transcript_33210/m.63759 type:complete len:282 (+) Transcript_33210:1044-1889(+)